MCSLHYLFIIFYIENYCVLCFEKHINNCFILLKIEKYSKIIIIRALLKTQKSRLATEAKVEFTKNHFSFFLSPNGESTRGNGGERYK